MHQRRGAGDRQHHRRALKDHAIATCAADAPCEAATLSSSCARASLPAPSGNHGRKAISSRSQLSRTSSERLLDTNTGVNRVQLVEIDHLAPQHREAALAMAPDRLRSALYPAATQAALRGHDQPIGIRVERLGDQPLARPVGTGRVDEAHPSATARRKTGAPPLRPVARRGCRAAPGASRRTRAGSRSPHRPAQSVLLQRPVRRLGRSRRHPLQPCLLSREAHEPEAFSVEPTVATPRSWLGTASGLILMAVLRTSAPLVFLGTAIGRSEPLRDDPRATTGAAARPGLDGDLAGVQRLPALRAAALLHLARRCRWRVAK